MDERLRFVARLLDGEKMAELCRSFGISRKTGYKIFERYKELGLDGLTDRSRRPYRQANQLPLQVEKLIVALKKEQPTWGAPKIRERLKGRYPDVHTPAVSTVHAVLDRHDLVKKRRHRRYRAEGTALSRPCTPNDLWCADYKGEFMLSDRRYCYPLTITDFDSHYLLACEALSSTKEDFAFAVFERVFKEFGVPLAQNGRHERMHLTLKAETTKPAGSNFLQQQGRFDDFIEYFNQERPHQALAMKSPASRYNPSPRPYRGLPELEYPFHDKTVTVTTCGRICIAQKKVNLSVVFAGQKVGIKQVDDRIWLTSFMSYDLGYFDEDACRLEPIANPFAAKVLPGGLQ
jgi:putative transposase